ncbi:MAG: hypothetical protein GC145_00160 [Caulobacter sp.]|nr:hypothetical protein [Caulobacter sp.]
MTLAPTLETLGWVARPLGVWYVFTGAMALNAWRRTVLGGADPDGDSDPVHRLRRWTVLAVGLLTLMAGLLLATLNPAAPYLFLACAALQGAYFAWARRALPPVDERSRRARAASLNNFFLFVAVTLFVLGCRSVGLFA